MTVKRKRIGALIGSAIVPYMRKMLIGMYQAADDLGVDLVVFAGSQIDYNFLDGGAVDRDHDFMNALIREHVVRNRLDGMLIVYGSHAIFMNQDERKRLMDGYKDIPYILIEEYTDKPGTGYIINDNYNGMRKVVEHLVTYHGYTKFLYMSGRADNREAMERQRAFEDVLTENDIKFTPQMMIDGHFSESCEKEVEELLDRNDRPEVIVCANDLMAYGVYKVLKKRGISVGNPRLNENAIAVTGYDDDIRAVSSDPPLTTVAQDFYYEGYTAVENILVLLRDGIIEGNIVPTNLQCRSSCGCNPDNKHRYLPMNDTERSNPEFYAIKVAELMREEILISNVKDEIGDKIYDILYEGIYRDVLIINGYIKDTLNADLVIDQLRKLIDSPYRRYISPYALMRSFSDYLSSLIHASGDQRNMVILSDIMVGGMKYLQNHILNLSDVEKFKYETEALQLSILGRNMSLVIDDEAEMFKAALNKIEYADKSDIFVFLYDKPMERRKGTGVFAECSLMLAVEKTAANGIVYYPEGMRSVVRNDDNVLSYAARHEGERSERYCFADIHHADTVYGLVVSRMDDDDVMYLTLLALHIGMLLALRNE